MLFLRHFVPLSYNYHHKGSRQAWREVRPKVKLESSEGTEFRGMHEPITLDEPTWMSRRLHVRSLHVLVLDFLCFQQELSTAPPRGVSCPVFPDPTSLLPSRTPYSPVPLPHHGSPLPELKTLGCCRASPLALPLPWCPPSACFPYVSTSGPTTANIVQMLLAAEFITPALASPLNPSVPTCLLGLSTQRTQAPEA